MTKTYYKRMNKERAARGKALMKAYIALGGAEKGKDECNWVDLVADVLHAAKKARFDPESVNRMALDHVQVEIGEEETGEWGG